MRCSRRQPPCSPVRVRVAVQAVGAAELCRWAARRRAFIVVENWIFESNLRPFLCMAFDLVEYEFDESDWQAVKFGIHETDAEQDKWFEYDMETEQGLSMAIAHDNNSSVTFIKATSTPEIEMKVALLLDVMGNYHLS